MHANCVVAKLCLVLNRERQTPPTTDPKPETRISAANIELFQFSIMSGPRELESIYTTPKQFATVKQSFVVVPETSQLQRESI